MNTVLWIAGLVLAFLAGGLAAGTLVGRTAEKETASGRFVTNPDYEHLVSGTLFQLSAEGRALIEQAYATAMKQVRLMQYLCEDPAEKDWELRTGENGEPEMYYQGKRVALISDVDDTLVDGAHYTCSVIAENGEWNNVTFARFLMKGCTALPYAVEFIREAVKAGIEVFYVTNRSDQGYTDGRKGESIFEVTGKSMYDISLASMKKLGFPVDDQHLIVNDGKKNGSSKEPARNAIRNGAKAWPNGQRENENTVKSALTARIEPHFVAMYLGDQITDFTDDFGVAGNDAAKRAELVKKYAEKFGTEWILLPNAMYGQAVDNGVKFGPKELFRKFTGWVRKK